MYVPNILVPKRLIPTNETGEERRGAQVQKHIKFDWSPAARQEEDEQRAGQCHAKRRRAWAALAISSSTGDQLLVRKQTSNDKAGQCHARRRRTWAALAISGSTGHQLLVRKQMSNGKQCHAKRRRSWAALVNAVLYVLAAGMKAR